MLKVYAEGGSGGERTSVQNQQRNTRYTNAGRAFVL